MKETSAIKMVIVDKHSHDKVPAEASKVALDKASVVEVQLRPEDVASLERKGDSLVLTSKSGEVIVIDNFYVVRDGVANDLVLIDDKGAIWQLQPDPAGGFTNAFVNIAEIEPLLIYSEGALLPWLLGGLGVLAVGGIAAAGGGGGSRSPRLESDPIVTPNADNVINIAESDENQTVTLTGTLSRAPREGQEVIVIVNGEEYIATINPDNTWTVDVLGSDLRDDLDQTVDIELRNADGRVVRSATETYEVDVIAPSNDTTTISINDVTADNELKAGEVFDLNEDDEEIVEISGTVSGEFNEDDIVVLTINGVEYNATVAADGSWAVDVLVTDLRAQSPRTISASMETTDAAGNLGTITATKDYIILFESFELDLISDTNTIYANSTIDNITNATTPTVRGEIIELGAPYITAANAGTLTVTLFDDVNNDGILDAGERVFVEGLTLTVDMDNNASFETSLPLLSNNTYNLRAALVDATDGQLGAGLLDGDEDARLQITTVNTGEGLGWMMVNVGDFNGDGIDDFLVSAPNSHNGANVAGQSNLFLLYGNENGLPSADDAREAMDANTGIQFMSTNTTDFGLQGMQITALGDLNGDGFNDFAMTSHMNDRAYVVFGRGGNEDSAIDLKSLDAGATDDGFAITGNSVWAFSSITGGDINGDGYVDLMFGDILREAVWVVYGTADGWNTNLSMATVPFQGFRMVDEDGNPVIQTRIDRAGDEDFGDSLVVVGDINGDGWNDYIIAAPYADGGGGNNGRVFLLYGTGPDATPVDINIGSETVVRWNGSQAQEVIGGISRDSHYEPVGSLFPHMSTIKGIGDVNGDGIADFAIGSPRWESNGGNAQTFDSGRVYVIYGNNDGMTLPFLAPNAAIPTLEAYLTDPNNGFVISNNGANAFDAFGWMIGSAGDVNGDGIDDFLVGAPGTDADDMVAGNAGTDEGRVYLVLGQGQGFGGLNNLADMLASGQVIDLGTILNAPELFANDHAGTGGAIGDWDGDGISDLAYGVWGANIEGINDGNFVTVNGSVFAEDVGDYIDVQFGSSEATDEVTVVPAVLDVNDPNIVITPEQTFQHADRIFGTVDNDTITNIGGLADGIVEGPNTFIGLDVAYGGAGNDIIGLAGMNFARVDGGNGIDTLNIGELNFNLYDMALKVQGFEKFEVDGLGSLGIRLADVLYQGDTKLEGGYRMMISGDGEVDLLENVEDSIEPTNSVAKWMIVDQVSIGGTDYDVWRHEDMGLNTNGDLLIQQGMSVV